MSAAERETLAFADEAEIVAKLDGSVFPQDVETDGGSAYHGHGLTKREAFAAVCLHALCTVYPPEAKNAEGMARRAVACADALAAELAKERSL